MLLERMLIFSFLLSYGTLTFAKNLNCEYGVIPEAPILFLKSTVSEGKIGPYSEAAFQGTPKQKMDNISLPTNENEFMKFQLESGQGAENMEVIILKSDTAAYPSKFTNPKSPFYKKMNGTCNVNK